MLMRSCVIWWTIFFLRQFDRLLLKQKVTPESVRLDLLGPLPLTPDGNRYVLKMQDNSTKYCLATPISNKSPGKLGHLIQNQACIHVWLLPLNKRQS